MAISRALWMKALLALTLVATLAAVGLVAQPAFAASTLSVSEPSIGSYESVSISFDAGTSAAPQNWIAIYREGDTVGSTPARDWQYVPGVTGGVTWGPHARDGWTATQSGAIVAGKYMVYLLADNGYTVLAGPISIMVTESTVGAPSLTVDRSSVGLAGSLSISYDAKQTRDSENWIAIYREGDTLGSSGARDWRYVPDVAGDVTWGPNTRTGWTATQSGSIVVGKYKVYLLADNGYTVLAGPVWVTVAPSSSGTKSLVADRSSVSISDSVTLSYDAGDSVAPQNWIAIYREGDTVGSTPARDWRYVPDATGTATWAVNDRAGWESTGDLGVGHYKVYLLSNNGYTVLAGPVNLTVTWAEPKPAEAGVSELSVLTLNLLGGGTVIDNGVSRLADVIRYVDADVIFTQEGGSGTSQLARLLGYHHAASGNDTGVLSRYPIADTGGADTRWEKAVIDVNGIEAAVYSVHLPWYGYANYLPRGYGAQVNYGNYPAAWSTLNRLPAPVTDSSAVLDVAQNSERPAIAAAVLADAEDEKAAGRLTLLGGDFNEPSAQDWTAATSDLFDHNGTIIPWPSTSVLMDGGMIDAYREKHPDPATHPGFTWAIENPELPTSKLSWTPEADERDRIDFTFYTPDDRIALGESVVVGSQGTIVRGQVVGPDSSDPIVTPPGPWPSDHKAVLSTYSVCEGGC